MKNEIKKQYSKALFFTIFPFSISLIFTISNTIINITFQFIIAFILLAIDIYFVLKLSKQDARLIYSSKEILPNSTRYRISASVLNRFANCEKIKGNLIKDITNIGNGGPVLLYDSHIYLEHICDEMATLISEITDIELEHISVSIIYTYSNFINDSSEWEYISDRYTTSEYKLNQMIYKPDSYYHYLIANNISASFENDKSKLFPRNYCVNDRDMRHKPYGSISAHKITFRRNGSGLCTGYLIISTYGKKLYNDSEKRIFKSEDEFEQILYDIIIPPFRKIIETEFVFLYMRHKYREENNTQ